jgi:tRNA-2-methylthio-N6-dimethylallyladenosine synthase
VNAYGKDFDDLTYRLGDLMNDLRQIDMPRIRFTTSHPRDFDDHLIEVLSKRGNLVEHIHLPVQSGSSSMLKLMARKYNREQYMELVRKIKATIPEVALTTDIIVGFPNETDEQFEETMSLYKEVGFEHAYTYIYSPREGTPAAKMEDNVPMEVKKHRLQRLNNLVNELSAKAMQTYNGEIVEVLVEGESKKNSAVLAGYTRTSKLVNFVGTPDIIGKLVLVKITNTKTWSLEGELIEVLSGQEVGVL